jgi:hypothetical protein
MRVTPIPDELLAAYPGAERRVIGPPDGDVTGHIRPVECLFDVTEGGITRANVRCVLEEGELTKLAAGGAVWVSFYAGLMVPFSIDCLGPHGVTEAEARETAASELAAELHRMTD